MPVFVNRFTELYNEDKVVRAEAARAKVAAKAARAAAAARRESEAKKLAGVVEGEVMVLNGNGAVMAGEVESTDVTHLDERELLQESTT